MKADPQPLQHSPRPRLKTLIVKNFRGIGVNPVEIELDKIIVLVGPNNVGKSSILRAYEIAMSEGSDEAKLSADDFPGGKTDGSVVPEIELHTVVYNTAPGQQWIFTDPSNGEMIVRERWRWFTPGAPTRQGYDVQINDWSNQVPWGAPNVANYNRPKPHRVDAFSDPKDQAQAIIKLLSDIVKERVKAIQENSEEESDYKKLLTTIANMRKQVIEQSTSHIQAIEKQVSNMLGEVFPDYVIRFDPKENDGLEQDLNLFKQLNNAQLLMGKGNGIGHLSTIDRQGSGARRTLLWSALRLIAETSETQKKSTKKPSKKDKDPNEEVINPRPHVLLLDEPELCLHPNAVRDACRVLYDLPETGNWQVIVTTHSPAFIDVSRDNTTIIRVEQLDGNVSGTTIFRPTRAQLDPDDRALIKLLNHFDPYVAEFFFGGKSIIVEGDTEYTAFKYVMSLRPEKYKNAHVIRARGKATIVALIKILNHFSSGFSVLHDSDTPYTTRKGKSIKNPAWAHNEKILTIINSRPKPTPVRLLASIINFETALFNDNLDDEKPYNAILQLKSYPDVLSNVELLLDSLHDHSIEPPIGICEWNSIEQLEEYALIRSPSQAASTTE